MILILSSDMDLSTDNVTDYLDEKAVDYIRVNANDLLGNLKSHIVGESMKIAFRNRQIDISKVNVIWNRKWASAENIRDVDFLNQQNNKKVNQTIKYENRVLNDYLLNLFENKTWIDHPTVSFINKLKQLDYAKKCGLNIPDTLLTSKKEDILIFKKKHGEIITKSIQSFLILDEGEASYGSYTNSILDEDLKVLPDHFQTSLFQKKIDKVIEIRSVFINGAFYSMAIFSQKEEQTQTDFRKYNKKTPSRNVPYKLPYQIEMKLRQFMNIVGLRTGSIDIIKSEDGNYVFLEVNPVGQYSMTSEPCNYNLDYVFAQFLLNEDEKRKRVN